MIVAAKNDTVVFDIPETYHNALVKNNTKHIWYKTTGGHDATVMDHGFTILQKDFLTINS